MQVLAALKGTAGCPVVPRSAAQQSATHPPNISPTIVSLRLLLLLRLVLLRSGGWLELVHNAEPLACKQ